MFSGHAYPEQRRLNGQQLEQVESLAHINVSASSIQGLINKKYQVPIGTKDVHNITNKLRLQASGGRTECQIIRDTFNDLLREEPNSIAKVIESDGRVRIILFQTGHMRHMLELYPSMLFVDATYSVNKNSMPLFVFLVPDANGEGQVVAYAIVQDERASTLETLFKEFENVNSLLGSLCTIVVDKDMNEIAKLREVYPDAHILLCRFHVQKALRSGVAQHCPPEMRDELRTMLTRLVYSKSEESYDATYEAMKEFCPPFMHYFDTSWHSCRESWALYALLPLTHHGHFTNNLVESHNAIIKSVVKRSSSVPDLIVSLLELQGQKKKNTLQKNSSMIMKVPSLPATATFRDSSILHAVHQEASPAAALAIRKQLEKAHTVAYEVVLGGEPILVRRTDVDPVRQYEVSSFQSCTCPVYLQTNLPCSHIFFARRATDMQLFSNDMVPDFAKKDLLSNAITSYLPGVMVDVNPVIGLSSAEAPAPPRVLSGIEKFRAAQEEWKILGATMVACGSAEFTARIEVLKQLTKIWMKGERAEVVVHSSKVAFDAEMESGGELDTVSGDEVVDVPVGEVTGEVIADQSVDAVVESGGPGGEVVGNQSVDAVVESGGPGGPDDEVVDVPVANVIADQSVDAVVESGSPVGVLDEISNLKLPSPRKTRGRPKGLVVNVMGGKKRKAASKGSMPKRSKRK